MERAESDLCGSISNGNIVFLLKFEEAEKEEEEMDRVVVYRFYFG